MNNLAQPATSKWKSAHDELSRILLSTMLKKFDFNVREVAHELGITEQSVNWNLRKLRLTTTEVNRYALDGDVFSTRKAVNSQQQSAERSVA